MASRLYSARDTVIGPTIKEVGGQASEGNLGGGAALLVFVAWGQKERR
jgi:hypothetical protein